MTQQDLAQTFRRLHVGRPLVLPNAWDAGSARVVEDAGAAAVATTSAGVSWAHGRRDGQGLALADMAAAVRAVVRVVRVPVTVDIESGYGAGTPADVAAAVDAVLAAGAVGVNLEDSPGRDGAPLLSVDDHVARIAAARAAARDRGVDLFVNVRTDVYLADVGDPAGRFDAVVRRAAAYVAAGADGVFVPAVRDADTIGRLAAAIDAPLNVMAGPGALSVDALADLGVARVSLGPSLALAALGLVRRAVREVLAEGTYDALDGALPFGDANELFAAT